MAMSSAALKLAMKSAAISALSPWLNPNDDHRLTNLTQSDFLDALCGAIASTVVAHIQSNAVASGLDSRGDSHSLTIS